MLGNRIAVAVGALGVAAAAAIKVAQRRRVATAPAPAGPDPRAEELRRKLAEARDLEGDREEFEAAETPVDHDDDVDERRRRIHDEGRSAAEEMRGASG